MSHSDHPLARLVEPLPVTLSFLLTSVRFGLVGLSGVVVNTGVLWGLTELAGLHYLLSSVFAVEISILTNFALNEVWTFDSREGRGQNVLRRAARFNLVYALGMGINVALLWVAVERGGLHYLLGNLVGIVGAFVWNFLFSNTFVWDGPDAFDEG